MVTKEEHMSKSCLIFSIIFITIQGVYSQNADEMKIDKKDSIEVTDLQLSTEIKNQVYHGKPLVMSLLLPGAGQFYNKSPIWKTVSFLAVEFGSVLAYNHFNNQAKSLRKDNQKFADENWNLGTWITNRFDTPARMYDNMSWTNFPSLNKLNGTHDIKLIISGDLANELNLTKVSSDSLEINPDWYYTGDLIEVRDRHFYENISKYDQFLGGWSDARNEWYWEEKNVGDSIEVVIKTPLKESFINERFKTNQKLNAAKYCINALMFNHVISVIDAVWSSQRNVKKDNQTNIKTQFNLVYNPYNSSGVGGLKFSLFF